MSQDFTRDVMRALGLSRLPVEGMESRKVLGLRVWIAPLVMPNPTRWKRSTHRLLCICTRCSWDGSVGRLDQHKCAHPETHCWGCGALLERETDTPLRRRGHYFCSWRCTSHDHDDEPQDFDAQDRRAAMEERIANIQQER
jgi:hypothetical protein